MRGRGSRRLHSGTLDNACGCKGRRDVDERDRDGMIDAMALSLVETVGNIGGEDALNGQ